MPMKIEAAAVTQKRPAAEFNNDSVNINGKVFSREIIKNGYKGSGIVSGDVYFALASSCIDGFADAAVAAFNENAASFGSQSPESVLGEFFANCEEAISRTEHAADSLVSSNLYASGRKVVIALNGNTAAYKFSGEVCVRCAASETNDKGVSTCIYPDVSEGDIYILVSPGVTATLSDKDIEDICKVSDGSVKRIVNLISKVALSKDGTESGSAIAVKILETALDTEDVAPVILPDFSDVAPESTADAAEEVTEEVHNEQVEDDSDMKIIGAEIPVAEKDEYTEMIDEFEEADAAANAQESDSEETDEEDEETGDSGKKGKILVAVGAVIALIVVCLVVVFVVRGFGGAEETTADETTTVEETTEEETTEEETTEEETTEEETTEEETTAEETTTRRATPVVTPSTTRPATTTQPATTEAPTTSAPTTEANTTAAPESTTATNTTAAPEPSTEANTTAAPEPSSEQTATTAPEETPAQAE